MKAIRFRLTDIGHVHADDKGNIIVHANDALRGEIEFEIPNAEARWLFADLTRLHASSDIKP
jgi:hypothetical protein